MLWMRMELSYGSAEEKNHGAEKPGAGFGFASDREYACGAVEEDCVGEDGGGFGEIGVLQSDRVLQRSDGFGDD
jgi:hypothetical protein